MGTTTKCNKCVCAQQKTTTVNNKLLFVNVLQKKNKRIVVIKVQDAEPTREGVVSEDSVGCDWAACISMAYNRAPPESRHVTMLRRSEAIWVQTRVGIEEPGAVCFSRGQWRHTDPVTVYILTERRREKYHTLQLGHCHWYFCRLGFNKYIVKWEAVLYKWNTCVGNTQHSRCFQVGFLLILLMTVF